jgi:hypothetical protein
MNRRVWYVSLVAAVLVPWLTQCAAPRSSEITAEQPPQEARPAETIRIGAWNIEWLGSAFRRPDDAKGVARLPEDLATYILAADVDILGLEEIRIDTDDGSDTNTIVRDALRIVEQKRGGRWEHRLFPTRYGTDQCCGIAWDTTKVSLVGEPRIIAKPEGRSSQRKTLWARPPRGVTFTTGEGKTDFIVVVIHMKANYRGKFARHRAEEAIRLTKRLPVVCADPDVVIIGDANCRSHDEQAIKVMAEAGFVDLNSDDMATHVRYGPLDRALVPADQPEFSRRSFEVLSDAYLATHELTAETFRIEYSDHFMVITEIDVMPDDD